MKPEHWLKTAAVLMLLFAAGHTLGFLTFQPASPEGRAVWASMNSVHFSDAGGSFSYGGFYRGFGLSITASQLFLAWLLWLLASMARRHSRDAEQIAWAIGVLQVIGAGLSLRYFSYAPAALSMLSVGCVCMGAFAIGRGRRRAGSQVEIAQK